MINKDDWAFTTMTELADIRQHPILACKKRDSLRLFVKQMYMQSHGFVGTGLFEFFT